MSKFIRLTLSDGRPIYLRKKLIRDFWQNHDINDTSSIIDMTYVDKYGNAITYSVKESCETIQILIDTKHII